MKEYALSIIKKPKNIAVVVLGWILMFVLLRVFPVYQILKTSYRIPGMAITRKLELFFEYTFASFVGIGLLEQFLVLSLALLTVINIFLFVVYAKRQSKILSGKGFLPSIIGMFMGLFGVGCISCGAFILAPVLGVIGLGSYISGFSQYAVLISYVGLLFVIASIFYLLKKISTPQVCSS